MNDDVMMREQLSALADGELQGEEFARAVTFAETGEGQAAWQLYHLIGDTLRNSEAAHVGNPALVARLREQLAHEPTLANRVEQQMSAEVVQVTAEIAEDRAANAAVFRWKLAAGFASFAAVAALGWSVYLGAGGTGTSPGPQLAATQPPVTVTAPPLVAAAGGPDGQQIMLRDPRLDELLAAHKQFGSTTALQMPAGFLRNATFEAPAR